MVETTAADATTPDRPAAGSPSSSGTWSPATLGALAALGAAAVGGYRLLRRVMSRRWVRDHVRVTSSLTGSRPSVSESTGDGSAPTWAVRVESHPDTGTQALEEAER